jgi:hypothetical protein
MQISVEQYNAVVNGLKTQMELLRDQSREKAETVNSQALLLKKQTQELDEMHAGCRAMGEALRVSDAEADDHLEAIRKAAVGLPVPDGTRFSFALEAVQTLRRSYVILMTPRPRRNPSKRR